ncbi:hypothetical protein MKK84_05465 [Methylobacterium sp. E-065]|uniref:hypothetical protein n=1 Tax=Methylobacterium sp. E-065 TaxID=2836583 RepID=UPI001FBBF746|nr:hypothetical protein [Methylobacterium sp. E-065]MCJ2016880.1 hypothetical protein [Methylobacterium sp. E-065]
MSLRTSLKNLIRRDPAAGLRERAADLQARIPAPRPLATEPSPAPVHAEQVAQAGLTDDALAGGGIDHRDGTISYADATGKVSRRPVAHWLSFNALQMHTRVQAEMARRRILETPHLSAKAHAEWEERIRRELRSDAVHALTFRSDRVFGAAQAIRTGAEPATQALREQSDAELMALAPLWEAAVDLYQQRMDEESAVCEAASGQDWPGAAPADAGPEWRAWFQKKEEWRERTGVAAAEEASGEAGIALHEIEIQIADLSAASLAGLKLKARVAQRSDDIGVTWPDGLGEGLTRDLLAFTETQARRPAPAAPNLVSMLDLASATLDELQSLHDLADRVGSAAYAFVWTGRCKKRGLNGDFNVAGELMQWLGDALTDVETAATDEARRRPPTNRTDRETRLKILAVPIVQNGDPDETEAFARELLAHVQAERLGR